MKKRAKSNAVLFIVLSLILVSLVLIAVLVYSFRDSFFRDKWRGIETGENIADAYIKNERTAFIVLRYHPEFNHLYEATITFYDVHGNKYDYITNLIAYEQEIDASKLDLMDFSSIKGVYADYSFKSPFPAPTNQTSQTETAALTPLSEFWSWLKSFL